MHLIKTPYALSLISESQHGFRPCLSTETAICDMYEFIGRGSASGNAVVGIFLDVAKAFDCVEHDVLQCILSRVGFGESALEWLSSFLSNRPSSVVLDRTCSSARS